MKIRNGFVSNSSSSSFVVAFPKKPENQQELQDMMFTSFQQSISLYDNNVSTEEICRLVFHEICDQEESANEDEIADHFYGLRDQELSSVFGGTPYVLDRAPKRKDFDTNDEFEEADRSFWRNESDEDLRYAKERAQEFMKENKGAFILCTSYSDHKKIESIMEHGNIFRNLEHIKIDNH